MQQIFFSNFNVVFYYNLMLLKVSVLTLTIAEKVFKESLPKNLVKSRVTANEGSLYLTTKLNLKNFLGLISYSALEQTPHMWLTQSLK